MRSRLHARLIAITAGVLLAFGSAPTAVLQTRTYPKEIRGYKVERTVVEVKRREAKPQPSSGNNNRSRGEGAEQTESTADSEGDVDDLIQLGKPQLSRATPLGITFEVPLVVSPVKQSGHVDFLVFEDVLVNGTSVDIAEYRRSFDLPNKQPLTLGQPLTIYVYLPNVLWGALGVWSDERETWPVTGRVYVFGKFKKSLFTFKRVVPVELDLKMRNPLNQH